MSGNLTVAVHHVGPFDYFKRLSAYGNPSRVLAQVVGFEVSRPINCERMTENSPEISGRATNAHLVSVASASSSPRPN